MYFSEHYFYYLNSVVTNILTCSFRYKLRLNRTIAQTKFHVNPDIDAMQAFEKTNTYMYYAYFIIPIKYLLMLHLFFHYKMPLLLNIRYKNMVWNLNPISKNR